MRGPPRLATALVMTAVLLGLFLWHRHETPSVPVQAAGELTPKVFLPLVAKAQLSGTVLGQVLSLVDDRPLANATVCAPAVGLCAATDGEGNYRLPAVPPGLITLRTQHASSLPYEMQVAIAEGETSVANFSLAPMLPEGETQIVLRWDGSQSPDLDAMLWLPYTDSEAYLVYAAADHRGVCSAVDWPRACWSDAPAAFGNYRYETIAIKSRYEGVYRFAAHDAAGAALPPAIARVRVFDTRGLVGEFNTPAAPGSWWYVFDLDGQSGTVQAPPGSTDGYVHIMNPGPYHDVIGRISSQSAGQPLAGALVCRADTTDCATSDADGDYMLPNQPSDAWLVATALEHVQGEMQGIPLHEGLEATLDFALQPAVPEGQLLIGLQWNAGEITGELEAHLWLPLLSQAHVYPANPGNCDGFPHACLREESHGDAGAQTIRITDWYVGDHVFAAHYPDRTIGEAWTARVRVFDAEGPLPGGEFEVPAGDGGWWHVFDISALTADRAEIIARNELGPSSPAPY